MLVFGNRLVKWGEMNGYLLGGTNGAFFFRIGLKWDPAWDQIGPFFTTKLQFWFVIWVHIGLTTTVVGTLLEVHVTFMKSFWQDQVPVVPFGDFQRISKTLDSAKIYADSAYCTLYFPKVHGTRKEEVMKAFLNISKLFSRYDFLLAVRHTGMEKWVTGHLWPGHLWPGHLWPGLLWPGHLWPPFCDHGHLWPQTLVTHT